VTTPVRPETDRKIDELKAAFPQPGSALLPALHAIQEEKGHISTEAMEYVAGKIGVAPAFVAGVVSFYTMFQQKPVGRHHIQLCRTLPCALRGAAAIRDHLVKRLGIGVGETTKDGRFSLIEVECLGTCDTAPICQVNDEEHGRLDAARVDALLESLR